MGRYNSFPQLNSPPEPFENALRVGKVRVRTYKSGSVKHAHVVLKKVDEEVYEDSLGRKRRRGVFSLFAHKVINCKPGKEIFFAVDNYLDEHVLAFEADLLTADETDNDGLHSAKSEETLVQRESQPQSLPPKMRKMWAKRESMTLKPDTPRPSLQEKVSVAVQTDPLPAHFEFPASFWPENLSQSVAMEPLLLSSVAETQTESIRLDDTHLSTGPPVQSPPPMNAVSGAVSPNLLSSTECDVTRKISLPPETESRTDSHERSFSPMDLESEPSSPQQSPRLLVRQIPQNETNEDKDAHDEFVETVRKSPAEAVLPSNETRRCRVKEEPEDVALPPSPPPKPKSVTRSFRAPVFVPARHNPFQHTPEISDQATPPSPASFKAPSDTRPMISVTPTPLTVLKKTAPATPVSGNSSNLASPVVDRAQAEQGDGSASLPPEKASMPSVPRKTTRPAPAFVPATNSSRNSSTTPSGVEPAPIAAVMLNTSDRDHEAAASVDESSMSESDTLRKRKRTHTDVSTYAFPERQPDMSDSPSKKWKPIVKQEPQSPMLSAIPISESISNGLRRTGPPQSLQLSLSIPPFTPSFTPSSAASQPDSGQHITPVVKDERNDLAPMSTDPRTGHQTPTSLSSYHSSRSYIDLTRPRTQWDRVPPSAPGKRPNKPRRTAGSIATSLPIITTAQIKMDVVGRDIIGVRLIAFDPTGERFAVICRDNSIRIWDNAAFVEIAKLAHSSMVISAVWLEGETAIASMGSNGVISKWALVENNKWTWEKLVESGEPEPSCFVYHHHRIAVATSRRGVRVWECMNGHWLPLDRDIHRVDVLSMKFINDGNDLLCACSDGNLVQYSIPRFRMQPVTKFKTKVFHVDVDFKTSQALVAQAMGSAHLVDISQTDRRVFNRILQDYSLREAEQRYGARGVHGFKPIFTDYGDAVVFGSIDGRVLVWDRRRGQIVYEMDHGDDVLVQAVASFDGENGEQHLVSCTKFGLLTWWRLPFRIF